MLPPASCRAPRPAAAAADATPESLPDLHQILLLLLADRSHSSLLSPCEISGTEYTALPRLPFPACARRVSHPAVMSVCFSFAGWGFQLRQNFDMKKMKKEH